MLKIILALLGLVLTILIIRANIVRSQGGKFSFGWILIVTAGMAFIAVWVYYLYYTAFLLEENHEPLSPHPALTRRLHAR